MNVHRKIITLNIEDFSTRKIAWWNDCVFLFDTVNPAVVQLASDYSVVGRLPLKEVKKIDAVLFDRDSLIIADSLGHRIHCLGVTRAPGSPAALSGYTGYPLPVNAVMAAAFFAADRYLFLDKNTCMICVYDPDFNEIKTVGSRMGYVQLYEDEESQRLGFEFPGDMAMVGDRVVVSDFDRSLMAVSLEYGFLVMEESDYPVDFFQSFCDGRRSLVGSEHGNELVELELPGISVERI